MSKDISVSTALRKKGLSWIFKVLRKWTLKFLMTIKIFQNYETSKYFYIFISGL
jgi:hypothetical protein